MGYRRRPGGESKVSGNFGASVKIVLRSEPAEGAVQLSVCDNGEGIASEDILFVFDRFYRGDRARARDGAGSGLVLVIARGIVEAHGGRIWIEPTPGHGATVKFSLPAAA